MVFEKFQKRMKEENLNIANVFILTGEWMDRNGINILRFIGTSKEFGAVEINITNNKPVFFVERDSDLVKIIVPYSSKEVDMSTFGGKVVDALYFNTQSDLRKCVDE